MNSSDATPSPCQSFPSFPAPPSVSDSKSCNGHDAATSRHDSAPTLPSSTGRPSCVSVCGSPTNGSGCRSGREKRTAVDAWRSDRMLMTMCEGEDANECAEVSEVAMREGMRSEKATRGCGSMEMELKEERVAPWNLLLPLVALGLGCA